MKPVVIIAISVGISVVAVLGVFIGIAAYQQAQLEKQKREAEETFRELMKKVLESQEQSQALPQHNFDLNVDSGEPKVEEIQPSTQPLQTNENNCDPSYPDVCIPPSPPDLDCGEIQYRNFKVLTPDPHRFDGDKDGIGCE